MKNLDKNKMMGVIFFGPQGSGKGTQAKLLADKFDFFHFDSGGYLRKILYNPKLQKNKIIRRERKLNEAGKLNTELWVTKIVSQRFKKLIDLGQSIVTEGFPRTLFETFGDKKTKGAIDVFEKGYGRNNIFIFVLNIPEKESIKRTTQRFICSICKAPLLSPKLLRLGRIKFKICPFCGGKIVHRVDDNRETIITRLREYKQRTQPIFKELERRKYKIYKIDGAPMPAEIHQKIIAKIFK
jgi:adenylate kinase